MEHSQHPQADSFAGSITTAMTAEYDRGASRVDGEGGEPRFKIIDFGHGQMMGR